jgi:hypothetical protein
LIGEVARIRIKIQVYPPSARRSRPAPDPDVSQTHVAQPAGTGSGGAGTGRPGTPTSHADEESTQSAPDTEILKEVARAREAHLAARLGSDDEELYDEITQALRQEFGPSANLSVEPFVVTTQSIELLVVLTALGNFLGTYSDLMEKIGRAAEITRRIISRIAQTFNQSEQRYSRSRTEVTSTWRAGPASERFAESVMSNPRRAQSDVVQPLPRVINGTTRDRILFLVLAYALAINVVLLVTLLILAYWRR